MPIFEYLCDNCQAVEEVVCKYADKQEICCPYCVPAFPMTRILSDCSFILNGGGWYSFTKGKKNPGVK